ncbi:MAG: hypothetical protein INR69_17740 [Mucilaginibacter polytrichastri]|nr:hypothetical protein [Mucilaginibacter polytrichastri]
MLISLFFSVTYFPAGAQTFAEFFRQRKTQEKYLLQQIVALAAFSAQAREGYTISDLGLRLISGFTGSERNQHHAYFSALNEISSFFQPEQRISTFASRVETIRATGTRVIRRATGNDRPYIRKIVQGVYDHLDELSGVHRAMLTEGYSLSDEQRLQRVQSLEQALKKTDEFIRRLEVSVHQKEALGRQNTSSYHHIKDLYE